MAKVEGLEHGVLTGDTYQTAKQFHQDSMEQRDAAIRLINNLKNITWEEALEHGSEIFVDMFLFYGTTKLVGIAGQRFLSEFAKLAEAIKA
ncbi:hypothetical protein GF322_00480, partial [Candidatus Dependentiae bacterium]|nr:hypothetical protein [Candidatus Dependentiae bacterium]